MGGLALDATTKILYGTTIAGGTGLCGRESGGGGTLFQISTSDKNFKVLHSFNSALGDGCNPWGAPVLDTAGNVYGTTLLVRPFPARSSNFQRGEMRRFSTALIMLG